MAQPSHPSELPDDALITAEQCSVWLSTPTSTLAKQRMKGRTDGPRFIKFGKSVRYRVGDVRKFVRSSARPA